MTTGRWMEQYSMMSWGKAYDGEFGDEFRGGKPKTYKNGNVYGFTGQRFEPELGVYGFAYRDYNPEDYAVDDG